MIVIGEKINGTRKEVARAIQERDRNAIQALAREQVRAGADFLEVNAGTHPDREVEDMLWLVDTVQEVTDTALALDSTNPEALAAAIRVSRRRPLLNSLSGEKDRVEGVLPLACRHQSRLVVLALDDRGIPSQARERLEIVRRLVELTRRGGLPDHHLFIDPVVTTIATNQESGLLALESMRLIKREFPQVHLTCGLSNISFGQASRSIINQAFAALALGAGLDSAILDPCDRALRGIIYAAEMVLGRDPDCLAYARAQRQGLLGGGAGISPRDRERIGRCLRELDHSLQQAGILPLGPAQPGDPDTSPLPPPARREPARGREDKLELLVSSLVDMKKDQVVRLTEELLSQGTDPLAILEASRRGMTEVGRLFEEEEYFLPELILAGKMLSLIADRVKPHLGRSRPQQEKKGRVLIGTVEGDIHDIGKDIVVTMLEINGYQVKDLGVNVPQDKFVAAAKEFKPQVIGLSGFLTLVYDPMRDTIAALRQAGLGEVKFMIGGGQMDEQIRRYTKADAYGRDAMEAVKLCEQWIG